MDLGNDIVAHCLARSVAAESRLRSTSFNLGGVDAIDLSNTTIVRISGGLRDEEDQSLPGAE